MKKNYILIFLTTFLLMFISTAYAAFSSELIISGEGIVEKDNIAPTCGSWYLRDSNLSIQEAYNQNKFKNPGTNTTWTTENQKLFIECTDNMAGDYGCINVTEITDNNNQKRYFKDVKEYTTSVKTDSNVVTVKLQDAYLNERTCSLPVGGSNPYLDKQGPTITITATAANKFTYSATDDMGVTGYMVTTSSTKPSIDSENWRKTPEEITIDNTAAKTYYVWAKDGVNITSKTINTFKLTKTVGTGTKLTLKYKNSTGVELTTGYVLNGTKVYVEGSLLDGYNTLELKKGTTVIATGSTQTISAATTISSSATPNIYSIVLDNQGANESGTTKVWYKYKTVTSGCYYYTDSKLSTCLTNYTITKPEKDGYTYAGYYSGLNGTGTNYVNSSGTFINNIYQKLPSQINSNYTDEITLYAKWIPHVLTVKIHSNGAIKNSSGTLVDDVVSTENLNYDGTVGYNWPTDYQDPWGFKLVRPGYNPEGKYHVGSSTATKTIGQDLVKETTPVSTIAETLGVLSDLNAGDTTVDLYAGWVEKTYTLTVKPNGGTYNSKTTDTSYSLKYSDVQNIVNPTRTGYTFNGWNELIGSYSNGLVNVITYTNANGSVLTVKTQEKSSDNPVTGMSNEVKITNSGTATTSPGLGGFRHSQYCAANKVYTHVFVAKLPSGYYFHNANNSLGTGGTTSWLTTNEGTGKWQTYAYQVNCGTGGSFSNFGYVYVSKSNRNIWGSQYNETGAVTSYLAYSNIYDITSNQNGIGQYDGTGVLTANWTANDYTVTAKSNGGSIASTTGWTGTGDTSTKSVTYDAAYGTLPTVLKTGYNFDGWYKPDYNTYKYKQILANKVLRISPMDNYSSSTSYFEKGDILEFDIDVVGTTITNADVNDVAASGSYTITNNTNIKGTVVINDSMAVIHGSTYYHFLDINMNGTPTSYTINKLTLTKFESEVTSSTIVKNDGDHTIYAKWTANPLTFNDQTVSSTFNAGTAQTITNGVVAATNGTGTYTYEITGGNSNNYFSLSGRNIVVAKNTPANTTGYNVTIKATDSNSGATKSATYTIKVNKGTCPVPTSLAIANTGIVTWTKPSEATSSEISIDNNTFTSATSGVNYNSTITATTGSRTVYVRSVCDSTNYTSPSTSVSKATTVYSVSLTKGTGISTVTGAGNYITGSAATIDATVNTGYTWSNWTGTSTLTSKANIITVNGNKSYTANATLNTYSIEYLLNGGTATNPDSYNVTTNTFTLNNPEKTGYTFLGWTGSNGSTPSTSVSITKGSTGNKNYTANYSIINPEAPTISGNSARVYNYAGRTLTCSTTSTYASGTNIYYEFGYASSAANWTAGTITWLGNPSTTNTYAVLKDAYIGTRYYGCRIYASDGTETTTKINAASSVDQSFVNARVYFDVATNGGTISGSENLYMPYGMTNIYTSRTSHATAGTLPVATKAGYTFDGWYTAATGGTKVIDSDRVVQASVSGWTDANKNWLRTSTSNNTTANKLYAQFTYDEEPTIKRNDYNTFTVSGTAASKYFISKTQTTAPNASATGWSTTATQDVSTTAKETWYVWIKDADGNVSPNSKTITNFKVTLSVGTGTTLTAKSDSATGTAIASNSYVLANTPVFPTGSLQTGYNTLVLKKGSTTITNGSSQAITADTTFTSSAKVNTYTVVFNKNASDATGTMSAQIFTYGSSSALTANAFTRPNYVFNGWNTKEDGTGTNYSDKQSVSNLTTTNSGIINLYAKWEEAHYKIGTTYYVTLADALNGASKTGSTIDVIKDYVDTSVVNITNNKITSVTLNTNGKTITRNENSMTIGSGVTLNITGTGTISLSNNTPAGRIINNGTINLSNATITKSDPEPIYNAGTFVMNSGAIRNTSNYQTITNAATGTFTINGGAIQNNNTMQTSLESATVIKNHGTLNITNGIIEGTGTFTYGVTNYNGATVNMSGGTVKAKYNSTVGITNGSGNATINMSGGVVYSEGIGLCNEETNGAAVINFTSGAIQANNYGIMHRGGTIIFGNINDDTVSNGNPTIYVPTGTGIARWNGSSVVKFNSGQIITSASNNAIVGDYIPRTGYQTFVESNGTVYRTTLKPVVKVIFNPNGGTLSGSANLYTITGSDKLYSNTDLTTIAAAPSATKTSYALDGWYTSATGGTKVLNNDGTFTGTAVQGYTTTNSWDINQNKTLYAHYVEVWAENIFYDNTNTGVSCTDAQCMLDYLNDIYN